ncbi:MAG: M3 family metallopeptidase [Bacteroidota bacterium]
MKHLIALCIILIVFIISCKNDETKVTEPQNPFFTEFDTPFGVPPFDKIDTTHYIPAFKKGIADQQAEIDNIVNNTESPDFNNTILAFDQSGKLLRTVSNVFFSLNSANTSPEMQEIARIITPLVTEHKDNISLNLKLFDRIKVVYENRESVNLDSEQKRVVEKYYSDFVRNGANLNDNDKEKLRSINQELSKTELQFDENLLAETNTNFSLIIDKYEDLAGLPEDVIEAASVSAKDAGYEGKWLFTLQKPSLIPFLQFADNRDLREKIYRGYFMRGNNNDKFDNKEIIKKIVNLRAEKANLLGYKTFAEYVIENNMAKTPDAVYGFLSEIMKPALSVAKKDLAEMQKIIDREKGGFKLESWDWWYYAEKLRKEKYNLDESEIKPYLPLENVKEGMFHVANQLYGLTFTRISEIPVYHPEAEAYEVREANGSHLGVLYLDYYPRPSKENGAWCGGFRDQYYENGEKIYPIITVVCNFTRPVGDVPALLSWDETTTLFHEFGHALHGLFTDGKYFRIAGNIPRDMVELPSQVMENWAGQPEVLKVYAKHYKTGEIIPDTLIEKMQRSEVFNQAFNTVEYIAASVLDLDLHGLTESKDFDVLKFETEAMNKIGLIKEIIPRYRTTYFGHIIGGYSAGYYVYLWAAVLDADAFQAFVESGDLYNKEIATKFRKHILTEGGNDEGMIQYKKFRGKDPSLEPLLKNRGLN